MGCKSIQPDWENGVPFCTEEKCCQYDGKRCSALGFRPRAICEPAVKQLSTERREAADEIESLREQVALLSGDIEPHVVERAVGRCLAVSDRARVRLTLSDGADVDFSGQVAVAIGDAIEAIGELRGQVNRLRARLVRGGA